MERRSGRSQAAAPAAKRAKASSASSLSSVPSHRKQSKGDGSPGATVAPIFKDLEPSWRVALEPVLLQPRMAELSAFVAARRKAATVYPPSKSMFSALDACALADVRVVILGQDPYHGAGQAHGACFSVERGVGVPPSLRNIFKEIEGDVEGFEVPGHGCLEAWRKEGVLLLNAVLTVEEGKANSHKGKGWEVFTNAVVDAVNRREEGVVFMLWGGSAKKMGKKLNQKKHLVLTAAHPSPLSANRGGWFGCKHFSKANEWLSENGRVPVDWTIS